jgi:hypothetical protein
MQAASSRYCKKAEWRRDTRWQRVKAKIYNFVSALHNFTTCVATQAFYVQYSIPTWMLLRFKALGAARRPLLCNNRDSLVQQRKQ